MPYVTNIADVLRGAGVPVYEHPGWKTRGHAPMATSKPMIVWHHDASPKGPSPSVASYMQGKIDRGEKTGDAQLWVAYDGTWHVIAAGKAYHAGVVRAGAPTNSNSLGVETDMTVGETWSPRLLDSLRRGTAALLRAYGHSPATGLHFHKSICSPPGRKVDPYGLDLASERATVAELMASSTVHVTGGRSMPSVATRANVADAVNPNRGKQSLVDPKYRWGASKADHAAWAARGVKHGDYGTNVMDLHYAIRRYAGHGLACVWLPMAPRSGGAEFYSQDMARAVKQLYLYLDHRYPGQGWGSGDLSLPGRGLFEFLGLLDEGK